LHLRGLLWVDVEDKPCVIERHRSVAVPHPVVAA